MNDLTRTADPDTTIGTYVLHPHVVFGIDEGVLFLSSSDGEALSTGDAPELLAVVEAFLTPRAPPDVIAELSRLKVDIGEIIEVFVTSSIR